MTMKPHTVARYPRIGTYNGVRVMVHRCCRVVAVTVLSFAFIEKGTGHGLRAFCMMGNALYRSG